VAGYFSTSGFTFTDGYFNRTGVGTPPLHALPTRVEGPNGVHLYGSARFPAATYNGMNWWVNVVFIPQ
jgi:hypothetical protein